MTARQIIRGASYAQRIACLPPEELEAFCARAKGLLPAFTLLSLAAVPCPPRHFELEPRLAGLVGKVALLDPGAAGLGRASHAARPRR